MKFGLEENIIHDISVVFSSFPEVEEVVLYGSRAKGNYKSGSDIDLAVKGDRLSAPLLTQISLKLDELYLPYTFDLLNFVKLDDAALISSINRFGVSFYRKGHSAG